MRQLIGTLLFLLIAVPASAGDLCKGNPFTCGQKRQRYGRIPAEELPQGRD
jgi:hypothetical protein